MGRFAHLSVKEIKRFNYISSCIIYMRLGALLIKIIPKRRAMSSVRGKTAVKLVCEISPLAIAMSK